MSKSNEKLKRLNQNRIKLYLENTLLHVYSYCFLLLFTVFYCFLLLFTAFYCFLLLFTAFSSLFFLPSLDFFLLSRLLPSLDFFLLLTFSFFFFK